MDAYSNPMALLASASQQSGLPLPDHFLTPQEISSQAEVLVESIFTNWNRLHAILQRYEKIIRKRWTKRNKAARQKVLLAAWPNMAPVHRPDFWALSSSFPARKRIGPEYESFFRWPQINLEDLVGQRALLILLNARGRCLPEVFAHCDIEACHIGLVRRVIRPAFLNCHTMYLAGQTSLETYGRLVDWDEDDTAFEQMNSRRQFLPGHGLLVLEIQDRIWDFLVQICHRILSDILHNALDIQNIAVVPEPPTLTAQDTTYVQWTVVAAEAPYRPPAQLEPQSLKALTVARLSEVEDHQRALREDPAYFNSTVFEAGEHRPEHVRDERGKLHAIDKNDEFWDRTLAVCVANAYADVYKWNLLDQQADQVDRMYTANASKLDPHGALPESLEIALLDLRSTLEYFSQSAVADLKQVLSTSPPIRSHYFRRSSLVASGESEIAIHNGSKHHLLLSLFEKLFDDRQQFLYRLPNLIDEIQWLMDRDREHRDQLTPLVLGAFADVALMAQLSQRINSFFPWAAAFEQRLAEDDRGSHLEKNTQGLVVTERLRTTRHLAAAGAPGRARFHYPINKVRNEVNVTMMRVAEHNLDRFWSVIDKGVRDQYGKDLWEILQLPSLEHDALIRTAEWSPPERQEHSVCRNTPTDDVLSHADRRHDVIRESVSRPVVMLNSEKVKTRGVPYALTSEDNPATAPAVGVGVPDNRSELTLSKRALRVFATLFYTSSSQDRLNEMPWTDFMHAMAGMGFEIEKMYGSAWRFTPVEPDVGRSITFHEPHPSGKIDLWRARQFGRRLTRTYGWTRETFCPEE